MWLGDFTGLQLLTTSLRENVSILSEGEICVGEVNKSFLFLNLQISQRFSLDTYFWRLLLSFEVSRIAQAANLSINVKKLIQFLATEFYNLIKYL